MTELPDYLTQQEVAELLRVHTKTIETWLRQGKLEGHKLGEDKQSPVRITADSVRALLESSKIHPKEPANDPEDQDRRILDAVQELGRGVYGGMVALSALSRRLGRTPAELEAPLRRLTRVGKLQLDPLSDPRLVPAAERELGIPDSVRGLLFYVSPARKRALQ